jgi:hypothetical protein
MAADKYPSLHLNCFFLYTHSVFSLSEQPNEAHFIQSRPLAADMSDVIPSRLPLFDLIRRRVDPFRKKLPRIPGAVFTRLLEGARRPASPMEMVVTDAGSFFVHIVPLSLLRRRLASAVLRLFLPLAECFFLLVAFVVRW